MASFATPDGPPSVSGCEIPFEGTRVVLDSTKGRCLVNEGKSRKVGEILYIEDALIYSSYLDDVEPDNLCLLEKVYGEKVCGYLDRIYEHLATFPKIECLDTARNLVQIVGVMYLKEQIDPATTAGAAAFGIEVPNLAEKIELLEKLQPGTEESVAACVENITSFKKTFPNVFPNKGSISTETVGRLLAILNNNQVELEDFGGSGLFVGTAIMEHSCDFNCSYTTKDNKLYMTATKDIPVGARLSIDYGNLFFSPTEERQSYLLKSYGFVCDCDMCRGADRKKAYSCPSCYSKGQAGVICLNSPLHAAAQKGSDGTSLAAPCMLCDHTAPSEHVARCLQREQELLDAPPETFEEVLAAGQEGLLHESHHLLFSVSDILARDLSDEAQRQALFVESGGVTGVSMEEVFGPAVVAMRHCCRLMDMVLPLVSMEKVLYYDRLGQLAVCAGRIDLAKQAFGSAHQMSCCASGQRSPLSLKLLALAENTPTTRAELRGHFDDDEMEY